MRLVRHAAARPHRCAVIPFIGNSNAKWGFIDCGTDLPYGVPIAQSDHVYVSIEAVQEMARMIGWQPTPQTSPFQRELEAEQGAHAETREKLEKAEAKLAAVAMLKNTGFKQQGAPGRPPKQKAGV